MAFDRAGFLGMPVGELKIDDPVRSRLERAFRGLCRRHRSRCSLTERKRAWRGP